MSNLKKEYQLFKFLSLGNWKFFVAGLALSILWPSASTATKLGLTSAQPFVISSTRFLIAGLIMLFISHVVLGNRLPSKAEWKSIIVYGFLNVSLYLGLYIIAMQEVSAGLGSLAIAINPVFISLIAVSLFAHTITKRHVLSLVLCLLGVINGWQTIIGGIFTFPILLITYQPEKNLYDANFWKSVIWLSIPVSIVAVQLWLYLVKQNPINASFWLFLCPIFGFAFAKIMMQEPISWFTFLGVLLVLSGLYLVQRIKK